MANRLIDNVIIIDSGMGNLSVVGGASSNITSFHVIGFGFLAINSTGTLSISGANTTDLVARFSFVQVGTGVSFQLASQYVSFSSPLRLSELKSPVVTASTGWIYLA